MAGDNLIRKIESRSRYRIHVVVTILSKAAHRMEVGEVLHALEVALIQRAILRVNDSVIGSLPALRIIGMAEFLLVSSAVDMALLSLWL